MLDRSQAPILEAPSAIHLPQPITLPLSNGMPAHFINQGTQKVMMLKLVFNAGKWYENERLLAYFTNNQLKGGTKNYTSQQLIGNIDYYGANLRVRSRNNHAEIIIHTLTKHVEKVLPLLRELCINAVFPKQELDIARKNSREKLLVNLQKTDYVADANFRESLFGENHPYGYYAKPNDFEVITTHKLRTFYRQHYSANNCTLFVAGRFGDKEVALINRYLGDNSLLTGSKIITPRHNPAPFEPTQKYMSKSNAMQTAIRVGKPFITKTHADYNAVFVLNTILGGFFGSRLMSNIREEKGYTYGIYSMLTSMTKGGYLLISTEVGNKVWEAALKEIFTEIERLQTDLVSEKELELVRNYLLGNLLSQLDDTFKVASAIQGLYLFGLQTDFYTKLAQTIQRITPQQIREYAQKYLQPDSFAQIVVGA